MKVFGKVFGATAASLALLAMSGTASALTYQGAEFTASATGAGTAWRLTLVMDFTNADDPGNEFLGDSMESWSLTMPEEVEVTGFSPAGWATQGDAQAGAKGCGNGEVNAICADFGLANQIDGGGPVIDLGDIFTFVVDLEFANDVADLNTWTGNFHLLSVRWFTNGCGRGVDGCWRKDGGLISEPLGVPEPGTLALLGLGLLGVGLSRRRRA